ncbi:hypothetical protein RU639_011570 [Aspergillus parasiticus]
MEEKDDPVTTCTSEAAAPIPTDLPLTDTRPTLACVPARRFHGLMPLQLAKKWANARLAQQNARERRRAFIKSFELRVLDISSTWPHTELQLVSEQNESSNPGDRAHYTRESENHPRQYDDAASNANPFPPWYI